MSTWSNVLKQGLDEKSFTNVLPPKKKQNEPAENSDSRDGQKDDSRDDTLNFFHVDAGINLSHKNLSNKINKIIHEAISYNVRRFLIISHSVGDAARVLTLTRDLNKISNDRYKVYCTIGVQPHDAQRTLENKNWLEELDTLISENLDIVVAIGKCGLDYDRMFAPKDVQIQVFSSQLDLARKYSLPLFLHERFAQEDFVKILEQTNDTNKPWRGLIHCFTGGEEAAKVYVEKGFYLSITGRVCDDYQNGELIKAIKNVIPKERIVISTDAPYMTPKDLKRRPYYNGSQFIPHISNKTAFIKGMKKDEFTRQIQQNLQDLLQIF